MQTEITIYNGELLKSLDSNITLNIEGLLSGNSVLQSGIILRGKWLFWDENYFNLMASMRKMRMKIPMDFTLDFFQNNINQFISPIVNYCYKIYVFLENDNISYYIKIENKDFNITTENYHFEVDVFKELKIYPTYLSSVENAKPENIVAKKFAEENDFSDVLFLNNDLKVARSVKGNIYYILNDKIYTNSLEEGAYRQGIDQHFEKQFSPEKQDFSAFELQKAEEVFILSESLGIIPINKFRKKIFSIEKSVELQKELIQ